MLLGERIRSLRRRRGLTVQALASSCGLSKGFISQVENGRTSPSLNTLNELAKVLGVSPALLVSELANGTFVTRGNGRHNGDGNGRPAAKAVLLSECPQRGIDMFLIEVPPGSSMDGHPLNQPGEQMIHVLHGSARVRYGDEEMDVRSGDTVHCDTSSGAAIVNVGVEPARMVLATYAAGVVAETNGEG